jgi:hypothetical protein
MILDPKARRVARNLSAIAAAISFVGLSAALVGVGEAALAPGAPPSGSVTLNPSTGDSSTAFQLIPPVGADCPGSGADNYRYSTFITPAGTDVTQLAFNTQGSPGPAPTANLRTPAGAPLRALTPAIGNNFLEQVTTSFQSGAFAATFLPPGDYLVGFACTLPPTGAATTLSIEEYWTAAITVTAQTGAGPNQFVYGPSAVVDTTTTVAATTTTTVGATTTTSPSTTTTTVASGTTTTTAPGSSTTTSLVGTATSTTLVGGFPATPINPGTPTGGGSTSGGSASSSASLVATGWSNTSIAIWGVLLLVFGRMAVLLGRTPKVIGES